METRRRPRAIIALKVTLKIDQASKQNFSLAESRDLEVDAVDIGLLGMGVFSKYYLPKGLRLELEIGGEPFGLEKLMKVKGEIRYCIYLRASTYRCGIKFINLLSEYKDKIRKFIDAYERRKAPRVKLSD